MGNKTGVELQENCQGDTEAWCETAGHSLSAEKLQENMLTLTGPGLTVCQAWCNAAGKQLGGGGTSLE